MDYFFGPCTRGIQLGKKFCDRGPLSQVMGKMVGKPLGSGPPLIINPMYTLYQVGIYWVYPLLKGSNSRVKQLGPLEDHPKGPARHFPLWKGEMSMRRLEEAAGSTGSWRMNMMNIRKSDPKNMIFYRWCFLFSFFEFSPAKMGEMIQVWQIFFRWVNLVFGCRVVSDGACFLFLILIVLEVEVRWHPQQWDFFFICTET